MMVFKNFTHFFNHNRKYAIIRVMKIVTDEKRIDEILSRGVYEVFTKEELKNCVQDCKDFKCELH